MTGFRFRKGRVASRDASFYCRVSNRVLGDCPHQEGPAACPVRQECAARTPGAGPDPSHSTTQSP